MSRITKKMKAEELKSIEDRICIMVLQCIGFGVNETNNIIDLDSGIYVQYSGKNNSNKYLKWGDGPFRRKELKFDPVNDFQLAVNLFNLFMERFIKECRMEGEDPLISKCKIISVKDGKPINGKSTKYLDFIFPSDLEVGTFKSEEYIYPSLAYIEIMFSQAGIGHLAKPMLKRIDELKSELEWSVGTKNK